jgi:hypothetical protein
MTGSHQITWYQPPIAPRWPRIDQRPAGSDVCVSSAGIAPSPRAVRFLAGACRGSIRPHAGLRSLGMDERERDQGRTELKALGKALFSERYLNDIPEAYLRELKRYLGTATPSIGHVEDGERSACWLNGRSLGVLRCTGIGDSDIKRIDGKIVQLNHVSAVDLTVNAHYDTGTQQASTGRRLTIGDPESLDIVLDASPGKFLPDKRKQIESFIDHLLAALAGHTEPQSAS